MRLDNTNQGELAALVARVKKLESAAPLGFSSITRGALRVASPEGLIIQGSASVSGILKGVGQFLWDGIVTLTSTFTASGTALFTGAFTSRGTTRFEGDTTQVGAHHVQGNQDITGTLAVKGAATLENNLNVKAGGKIIAEGPVAATLENGKLSFASGGELTSYAGGATLRATGVSSSLAVGTGSTTLIFSGNSVQISADGTAIAGPATVSGEFVTNAAVSMYSLPTISASGRTPNLWLDPATKALYRLV